MAKSKKMTNRELGEWFLRYAEDDDDMTITSEFQEDIGKRLIKLDKKLERLSKDYLLLQKKFGV